METENQLRLADVFVAITDPRQAAKVEHDLVELLVVAVCAVLVGADTFVEIELWARERLDWLRRYLKLVHGIPSHDTFGRLFGLIDATEFEASFRRWVRSILPALGTDVVAIDGKTSRRSGGADTTALHLVSAFAGNPLEHTPHCFSESVEKDHGRLETRRCYVFDQIACLHRPEQWPELKSFAVLESERVFQGKTTLEQRFYISSLKADAARLSHAVRAHWSIENRLHWSMDVSFNDDQMRARTGYAAHNLAVLKHITLNLIRLDPVKRKGGIKARRLIAATSDAYRAQLLGLG